MRIVFLCIFVDKSFHADKSGPIFVHGMNDTLKLMQKSDEWSVINCSDQSRYGILTVDYTCSGAEPKKCRFTFGTGVGVKNTEIVQKIFDAQPVGMR